MAEKPVISIVITHYKVPEQLYNCIASIYKKTKDATFEVIVVDNDETSTIEKVLLKKFPNVVYLKNEINDGYSGGNNLGAKYAKGDFLFFLNPDTLFENDVVSVLLSYSKERKNVGIVAPLLLNAQKKVYPLQGARELTPKRAIFSLSFIQKIFPHNTIANEYWVKDWERKEPQEVDVIPGTAFMIAKSLFEKLYGFDQKYFLFFEEHDLCNRVRKLGLNIYMLPEAQVVHIWGESTKQSTRNMDRVFRMSRFYYFKKFYGWPKALLTEAILRVSKETLLVGCIVLIAIFLRFYELPKFMSFIGDFGWFYISARDMLLSGQIPLVGIASSHPWLHQGAFWTYILAAALWIGNFNPIFGGYAAAAIGVITVFLLYIFSKEMFGEKVALFSTFFYASSPLVISFSRMPYHTAPIPLFVLLYIFSLYKWIKGSKLFFVLTVFWLVVLYNFELATAILVVPFIMIILYGIWQRKHFIRFLFHKKVIIFIFLAIVIPLLPMIIYDTQHNFVQTFGFVSWIGYRILVLFGFPKLHTEIATGSFTSMIIFFENVVREYFYLPSYIIAFLLVLVSFVTFFFTVLKKKEESLLILFLMLVIPLIGIFLGKVPSEAYLPMLFIQLSLVVGITFTFFFENKKMVKITILFLFFLIVCSNIFSLISQHFFTFPGYTFTDKERIARKIILLSGVDSYSLVGEGSGSEFESFSMPYAYLTWWYGKPETKNGKVRIIIEEKPKGIFLEKEYN